MSRLDEIRQILTIAYERNRASMAALRDLEMEKRVDNGWTVRQMAGHIAGSPSGDTYVVKRLRQGKSASGPGFIIRPVINASNWWRARTFKGASKAEILGEYEKSHNDFFALVNTLEDDELDNAGTVFGIGRLSTYEYLVRSPSHAEAHFASIRETIDA